MEMTRRRKVRRGAAVSGGKEGHAIPAPVSLPRKFRSRSHVLCLGCSSGRLPLRFGAVRQESDTGGGVLPLRSGALNRSCRICSLSVSVNIQDMQLFSDHLVVYERENGLPKITIYTLPRNGEPMENLQGGRAVDFIDPMYSVDGEEAEFSSGILRFSYSSLKTPPSVYDNDLNTGVSVVKKIQPVLGGFDSSKYVTQRQFAVTSDGTQVPISIVYRKDVVKLDGSDPLLLYGYGSYEKLRNLMQSTLSAPVGSEKNALSTKPVIQTETTHLPQGVGSTTGLSRKNGKAVQINDGRRSLSEGQSDPHSVNTAPTSEWFEKR